MSYLKDGYKQCTNCGKLIKIKSKFDSSTKYCDNCAKEIKNEQNKRYYHQNKD